MKPKNKHAQEMQRKGQAAIRKKYGPDFWKKIRAGKSPSKEARTSTGGSRD